MSRTADPTAKISLLRAAEEVFAEKGLAAAKVQDITARAGLSKGAFYLHFESKEGAFRQVVEAFLARCMVMCTVPKPIPSSMNEPAQVLAHWQEKDVEIMEFLWQNRGIVRILPTCQGEQKYLFETFRSSIQQNCIDWIEICQKAKLVREELDSRVAAAVVQGAWNELVQQMMHLQQKPVFHELMEQVQGILVRGLGTPALVDALVANERRSAHELLDRSVTRFIDRPVIDSERRRRVRS
ncbi:TetR family transcriptional regulator [Pendulispora albinea]|uniref:TetR/AcrR family transcriptional regulator n=1 Tax=Pendulispora albinea TaxID=2741071 RepID=A0ABZ2LZJ3_9BACT